MLFGSSRPRQDDMMSMGGFRGLPLAQGPGGVDQTDPRAMLQAQEARNASMTPEQRMLSQPREAPISMRGGWEGTFPTMQQQPEAQGRAQGQRWMDGGKFHLGDAFRVAMTVLGDAATNHRGGQGHSVENLLSTRSANMERNRIGGALRNQGYNDDQVTLATIDPASLGKNYNEQFGTRVVAPGYSVIGATPFGQRPQYRQPTDGEQYADAQGLDPTSPDYATALQDYTLRGNGPTAFGFDQQLDNTRTANDIRLEGERQSGRLGLEGLRQQNRMGLEGTRATASPRAGRRPIAI
jgi:hypothetical protein